MVGVTLLDRQGWFRQRIDAGGQREELVAWVPEAMLEPLDMKAMVAIGERNVTIRPWRFVIHWEGGRAVPVLLLNTDVDTNEDGDRAITNQLYGGDLYHPLRQEAVLGLGGMAVLLEPGWRQVRTLPMNEALSTGRAARPRPPPGGKMGRVVRGGVR